MGVTGSGKTTVGSLLAQMAGVVFADADDYHPAANKQKMGAGIPLTDDDREPWLETLNGVLASWSRKGCGGVMACSALKEKYREILSKGMAPGTVHFVLLQGSRELIASRLAARAHEYMNPKLLESQFQTLEVPAESYRIVNDRAPEAIASEILAHVAVKS